jgi:hypothetical protein
MTRFMAFIPLLLTASILACDGVLPKNNLYLPLSDKSEGLSREFYDEVIKKVERVYAPIAASHRAKLKIDRNWESGTVNAGTFRDENGKHWHINLYGGLARHPLMTPDGYALVICHEIGHHIGGAPKKLIDGSRHWSSTEGQADYWAALKCLRRIFYKEDNTQAVENFPRNQEPGKSCEESHQSTTLKSLCLRVALASEALTKISTLARRVEMPRFETPDETVVQQTFDKHPVPQCRLDSFFQGSLCTTPYQIPVSQEDHAKGVCHSLGARPKCWYRGN